MSRSEASLTALRDCLAFEHEAIWLYAYVGARIAATASRATSSYHAHRRSRDALLGLLHEAGATAPGPLPTYRVPVARDAAQAADTAQRIEANGQAVYLGLVGASAPTDRRFALDQLRRAALAALAWGAAPSAFPGLPG